MARAATCTRRTWRSTWTSTRLSTTTAIAPPPSAIPACASTPSPRRWRIWMPVAPSPSRVCARRSARLQYRPHSPSSPRAPRPPHLRSTPTFPSRRPSPRARALWRRFPIFRSRAWTSSRSCVASSLAVWIPMPPRRCWSPRWCRTTIHCLPTALAGRSSFAFVVDRSPTWSRISTAWPTPMSEAAPSRTARSSRLSIRPKPSRTCRQSCSTLL